jgi:hypothetical protein
MNEARNQISTTWQCQYRGSANIVPISACRQSANASAIKNNQLNDVNGTSLSCPQLLPHRSQDTQAQDQSLRRSAYRIDHMM